MVSFKNSPNAQWIFGLKWKATVRLLCLVLLGNFFKILGYFLILHLVTLLSIETCKQCELAQNRINFLRKWSTRPWTRYLGLKKRQRMLQQKIIIISNTQAFSTSGILLLNRPSPASFWSFETTAQFFNKKMREKIPTSVWCQCSNSQPLDHESLPITTILIG